MKKREHLIMSKKIQRKRIMVKEMKIRDLYRSREEKNVKKMR